MIRDVGRSLKEDYASLPYIRGQQDLTIRLSTMKSGRTQIIVGDEIENSSWQLSKPKVASAADSVVTGLEAADFPILNQSKTAKYDAQGKSINISIDATPLPRIAEQYAKELKSLGWNTESTGITSHDYVFLTFVKDKAEIQLRARITDGNATVNIQGDGLLWNKELAEATRIISFETWLRTNHHPATLELLDQYQKEMKSIVHSTPATAEKE